MKKYCQDCNDGKAVSLADLYNEMNFLLKQEKVANYLVFMRLLGFHMLQVEFSRPT
jgi:hypothetical protein